MFLFYKFSFFYFFFLVFFFSLLCFICILIAVAYFTLLDRKVMAAMQRRRGPNVVGFLGLLQPLADGLKLLVKEGIVPLQANSFLFMSAPILTFIISMVSWSFIPFSDCGSLVDVETGILFILSVSSFGVYGMILSGWSSNSKYAFLGALRSSAQMISYEVSIGFMLLSVLICSGTPNLFGLVQHQEQLLFWHCWFMWPQFLLLLFSAVAETNRAPFDLAEAESELMAGYFVEYSAMAFALFFLGEYSSMLFMCALLSIFFLGGWFTPISFFQMSCWFGFKLALLAFCFVWMSATYPSYSYDQLMQLGWKSFLPLAMGLFVFFVGLLVFFDGLPNDFYFNLMCLF